MARGTSGFNGSKTPGEEISEELIKTLSAEKDLPDREFLRLINGTADSDPILFREADRVRREIYGDEVYLRGLIEFTNHCVNNCLYCGIRRDNADLSRYRLDRDTIMECCREGYDLGYRTFVLQGGEDPYYTDNVLCDIVGSIHRSFPDCAITLSVGERSRESYRCLFKSGARRYLLRHETASKDLYSRLHPEEMDHENRLRCLFDLKDIGYQVGAGFMVGVPGQTSEHLLEDLRFLQKLRPDMIGIGPFLHHSGTPFRDQPDGSEELTLRLLAILRLMFPWTLIPATTALGTIDPSGRERGLKAGANVLMPNLSPAAVRKKYELYDNKKCTDDESAQCRDRLEERVSKAGYRIVTDIGDPKTV